MCVAVPAKIATIDENDMGIIDVEGVKRKVSLLLLENPKVGDYVIVHSGFAMRIIDESAAMETLNLLKSAYLSNKNEKSESA